MYMSRLTSVDKTHNATLTLFDTDENVTWCPIIGAMFWSSKKLQKVKIK